MVFAIGANVSRIVTTLILTLLLPKVMTVEAYSYWQLYLFYGVYLLYSSFGWCEGLYIKYGGSLYEELDENRLAFQIKVIALYETAVGALIIAFALLHPEWGHEKLTALCGAAVYMVLNVIRYQIQTILQACSRISEYARIYTGERLLFFFLSIALIASGHRSFYALIAAELLSNFIMMLYGSSFCKNLLLAPCCSWKTGITETIALIKMGICISFGAFLGQMVVGIVRFAVELNFGTVAFGKISLSLSMANMVVTCITAVSIVVFPVMKRMNQKKAVLMYEPIREILTVPMFALLLFYVPGNWLLSQWLPAYKDSLKYLAILLPLCIYEVRNTVLCWTYLKVFHGQRYILYANFYTLIISLAVTYFTVYRLESIDSAIISIMFLYGIKVLLTELMLKRYIPIKIGGKFFQELLLSGAFVALNWQFRPVTSFLCYTALYLLYLAYKWTALRNAFKIMKGMIS